MEKVQALSAELIKQSKGNYSFLEPTTTELIVKVVHQIATS